MLLLKRYPWVITIALVLVCSLTINVWAINDINDLNAELDKQQGNQYNSSGNMLWLEFIKLVVVLGLIIAAAWMIIKLFSKQVTTKMQGTWIQVVDEVTLGPNRGIVLCEVGEKLYALGVTENNINFLFQIDNPKLIEEINLSQTNNPVAQDSNINIINELTKSLNKLRPNPSSRLEKKDFHILMDEQFQRLEKIASNIEKNETNFRRSDNDG